MVRAILDGRKTMTRRVVNPSPYMAKYVKKRWGGWTNAEEMNNAAGIAAHIGVESYPAEQKYKPGARLWVRETFCEPIARDVVYRASASPDEDNALRWTPSIFMPSGWAKSSRCKGSVSKSGWACEPWA